MKVFISHSSTDKWVARQISRLIEADGHTTFLDEKDIKTGESIDLTIQQHLRESDHLLLLITPSSLNSHWVFIELGGAKALGKHIVPILLHVGMNELPGPIANLLAREINDFDVYLSELKTALTTPKKTKGASKTVSMEEAKQKIHDKHYGEFSVGDVIRIIDVEHLTPEDKEKYPKWVAGMDKYSGVVSEITAFSQGGSAFLKVAGDDYRWNFNWFIKAG